MKPYFNDMIATTMEKLAGGEEEEDEKVEV
jgi:hypothetical protein